MHAMKTLSLLIILAMCGSASWCSDEENYRLRQASSRQRQPHTKKETTRESSASIRSRDDSEICGSSTLKRLASMTSDASVWSAVGPISLPGGGTITHTSAQLPPAHPADTAPRQPASPYSLEEVQALRRKAYDWNAPLEESLDSAECWVARSPDALALYKQMQKRVAILLEQPPEAAFETLRTMAEGFVSNCEPQLDAEKRDYKAALLQLDCLAGATMQQLVAPYMWDMNYGKEDIDMTPCRALWTRALLAQAVAAAYGCELSPPPLAMNFKNFYEAYHVHH